MRTTRYEAFVTGLIVMMVFANGCLIDSELIESDVPSNKGSALKTSDAQPIIDQNELEELVFVHINRERQRNGVGSLKWNDRVAAVARRHSQDMAEKDYFDHVDMFGYNVDGRMRIAGLRAHVVGENIFKESVIEKTEITYLGGSYPGRTPTRMSRTWWMRLLRVG